MQFSLFNAVSALCAVAILPSCVMAASQTVMVGMNGALVFNPSNITANVGDEINFLFMSPGKNHSATQSSFAQPCAPLDQGANSGFLPVSADANFTTETAPTWSITVNTASPIWFHCAQTTTKSHCEAGMVFSINATPEKSFAQFLANAMNSSTSSSSAGSSVASNANASSANSDSSSSDDGSSGTAAAEENASTNGSLRSAVSKRALGVFAITSMIGAMLF